MMVKQATAKSLKVKRLTGLISSTILLLMALAGMVRFKYLKSEDLGSILLAQEKQISEQAQVMGINLEEMLATNPEGLSRVTAIIQTPRGKIKIKFFSNEAPKTCRRIITLIHQKFYDGLIFHRVVPGFVVQGGDPTGTGTGGSGTNLLAEFNSKPHVLGAVAMARATDPNSADSQFYISLGTHPHLDGQYTVFAQVVEGMDVVSQIQQGDQMNSVVLELQ